MPNLSDEKKSSLQKAEVTGPPRTLNLPSLSLIAIRWGGQLEADIQNIGSARSDPCNVAVAETLDGNYSHPKRGHATCEALDLQEVHTVVFPDFGVAESGHEYWIVITIDPELKLTQLLGGIHVMGLFRPSGIRHPPIPA
jgi:hypothetical protein